MRYPTSVLLAGLVLAMGCSGDSGSSGVAGSAAPAASVASVAKPAPVAISGDVQGAPGGTTVMLLEAPRGLDLLALGDAVIDLVEADAQGGFTLRVGEGRVAERVLVSAPGFGLLSAAPDRVDSLRLQPEAVVACRVVNTHGQPAEDAMALVLDPGGVVLPLPPLELVAGADGVLRATRLPAGACEILVCAVDAEQFGVVRVQVSAGETLTREVRLEADPDLRARFMRAAGVPEIPGLSQGGGQ